MHNAQPAPCIGQLLAAFLSPWGRRSGGGASPRSTQRKGSGQGREEAEEKRSKQGDLHSCEEGPGLDSGGTSAAHCRLTEEAPCLQHTCEIERGWPT